MISIRTPSFEIHKMLDMFFVDRLVRLTVKLVGLALHVIAIMPRVESRVNLSLTDQPNIY